MLLQDRLEELDSAIVNICSNRIELTGFMSEERLLDYYNDGIKCMLSTGVYPVQVFDIAYVQDGALFIILKDTKEISRYKFIPIKKDLMKYKDNEDNNRTKLFSIRKCHYTKKYNYKDTETSLLFNTKALLRDYMISEYNYSLQI